MTKPKPKPKGTGRGGARPNSGPKPNRTELALKALVKIATAGTNEQAVVAASKALLNHEAAPLPEVAKIGKKERAQRAAELSDTSTPMGKLMARRDEDQRRKR